MFIYVATNTVNGKRYVGQTTKTALRRWREHVKLAKRNQRRECRAFYAAIRKYGAEAFSLETLSLTIRSQGDLDNAEREAIVQLGTRVPDGYNLMAGGNGGKLHPETCARIGAIHKGKVLSEELKQRLSVAHLGQERTPETRSKISRSMKGIKRSPEHQEKLTAQMRTRKLSPERVAQLVAINKGRVPWNKGVSPSQESRDRQSALLLGRKRGPMPDVVRERIRASNQRAWADPERRRLSSERQKGRVFSVETRRKMSEAGRLRAQKSKKVPEVAI